VVRAFSDILKTAQLHKGGLEAVKVQLPAVKSDDVLASITDDRALSAISLRIFQAGLKYSMVTKKWPVFEAHFNGFEPMACAMQSDEALEQCMAKQLYEMDCRMAQ